MKRRGWFAAYVVACALAVAGVCLVYWSGREERMIALGQDLNRLAWEQSYVERGLGVPPSGPREGYWGIRVGKKIPHPRIGWYEPVTMVPTLLEVGENGYQRYDSSAAGAARLAIYGGSAAGGAYASSIDWTYFHVLGAELERRGIPADVTIVAGGAWKSRQELAALREWGSELASDVIVFLDGLNDVCNGATSAALYGERVEPADGSEWTLLYHAHDYEQRVRDYLANVEQAADRAAELGAAFVVVLQPALADRERRTAVEECLLEAALEPHASAEALTDSYASMRAGLRTLAAEKGFRFLDLSRLFDGERATTFADLWHFSDVGHELLAQALARELAPILEQRRGASTR